MDNSDSTIGEIVKYFMSKYKLACKDWLNDLSNIHVYNCFVLHLLLDSLSYLYHIYTLTTFLYRMLIQLSI